MLASRSLRRLWTVHIRDFPFETIGLEHNPGLDAAELMRSWYADERRDFLSWVSRKGPPALAHAAAQAMLAKGIAESFTAAYDDAEIALDRLDALLPSYNPIAALMQFVSELREEEVAFLESATEVHAFEGHTFDRPAPKGAAWAASLAIAMRPQLFGLSAAPLALSGLAPRILFRPEPEDPFEATLREAATAAVSDLARDLEAARRGLERSQEALFRLYSSARARDAWCLLLGLGPLTRAELARTLDITKRTASQAVAALERSQLVKLRPGDNAVLALCLEDAQTCFVSESILIHKPLPFPGS